GRATEFRGYDTLALDDAKVEALYREGTSVPAIAAGEAAIVVLNKTPFYAESGGQVGDAGEIVAPGGTFVVSDTQKIQSDVFGHHGALATGRLALGDKVSARVDAQRRARTMRNHSATHLMHKALREVLGQHVQQKGSLVDADKTRFDSSRELCGGTHVARTGDIGFFKITSQGGVAAGVRRVEATTGEGALEWVQNMQREVEELALEAGFKGASLNVLKEKFLALQASDRAKEKELARLKSKMASSQGGDLAAQAVDVKGIKVLAGALDGPDGRAL